MKQKRKYRSTGIVYGKLWTNVEAAYPAKILQEHSKKKLLKNIKLKFKDGSLDSGMGYQYLIGAIITIETMTTIFIKEVDYYHSDYQTIFIGKLNQKQKDFLKEMQEQCVYQKT